jgi:hypothetical protein
LDGFSGTVRIPLCKQETSDGRVYGSVFRGRFAPSRR